MSLGNSLRKPGFELPWLVKIKKKILLKYSLFTELLKIGEVVL
jgi:hypothetical protein